jgi:cation:H+ antiporter
VIIDLVMIGLGLVALTVGADYLVRAVVTVADRLNVSTLLVSLTVVALGTSLPEFFVVVGSLFKDAPGIGMGNIVGSNIANLLLVLGVAAVIRPIATSHAMLRRDGLAMLAGTLVFVAGSSTGVIGPATGLVFVGLLVAYFAHCFFKDGGVDADGIEDVLPMSNAVLALTLLAALAALLIGSELLVNGALSLARSLGVSETAIGLTLVAVGTSLPELATTLAAARRRQFDVIVGNVLGSNLFNLLGVVGVASLIAPIAVPVEILELDLWLMALASLTALVLLRTGWTLDRREATAMLAVYGVYVVFQFAPMTMF